jgi:vancomycin resistance protein YoaR
MVDLRFTNDTPHWLLIEAYVYPAKNQLLFRFYSTSDGRSVEWETTGMQDIVPAPPPEFKENAKLSTGQVCQADWAVDGAKVTVTRTVRRNGVVLESKEFSTRYQAWEALYEYGPGTEDPAALASGAPVCQP